MTGALASLRAVFVSDGYSDRVVPPSGFTARLTVLAAAAMAFLAVFAMALSLAAGRLSDRWGEELARSATIRIVAPLDQRAAQTDAALRILETTRGVVSARALSDAEQQALLAPWFGAELALDALPVPRLIEVNETSEGIDAAGLRLRLAAEVPGAVLDDHSRWREPLVKAASRLRLLGWTSLVLIAVAVAVMITLAAQAALAANAQVIAVLRLVGATDDYIAQAFVRRFSLRALSGAASGTLVGLLALAVLPAASDTGGFLTGLGLQGLDWFWPVFIPVLAGVVAFVATAAAARRALGELA